MARQEKAAAFYLDDIVTVHASRNDSFSPTRPIHSFRADGIVDA